MLLILVSVSFALLGVYSFRRYTAAAEQESRTRILMEKLRKADALADGAAAVAAYTKLQPALPEIQLRILHRQWRMAMELLQYMQRARDNSELQDTRDEYSARLRTLFNEMNDRSNSTLADSESLRPEIAWQIYTVAGSAKVLSAFVMLENDQNVDKVQGVMRDALTDFKAAIEAVDKADVPPMQRNIPRWNFELLNGEEYVKRFEVAMTDMEKNQVLKENLETLMPEMGGYAPGEPIETRIKK